MNKKDITGQIFGCFTAICSDSTKKDRWFFRCICGEESSLPRWITVHKPRKNCKKCFVHKINYNLMGEKFGKLKVIGSKIKAWNDARKERMYECQCECGKILFIDYSALKNGYRTRCRHCAYEDLTGQRFGKQVVLSRDISTKKWWIQCDCGNKNLKSASLIKHTKSCGSRCESYYDIGKKYGKLTIKRIINFKNNACNVEALCECGKTISRNLSYIKYGSIRSCGCIRWENKLKNATQMIGIKKGNYKILSIEGYAPGTHHILFKCRCDCGTIFLIKKFDVCDKNSCGRSCQKRKRKKGEDHPMSKLSNKERDSIVELMKTKFYKPHEISKIFNLNETEVYRICKTWPKTKKTLELKNNSVVIS